MILSFLKNLNWIDIVVIIIIARITYIAIKKGLFIEVFKFLGAIFAVFICLHYYTKLGDLLNNFLKVSSLSLDLCDFISFALLWIGVTLVFVLLRDVFSHLIKIEAISIINRWFSLFLGLARGLILASLLMYIFSIPAIEYLKKSVQNAYLGRRVFFVSSSLYQKLWNNFVSKFRPAEEFNQECLNLEKDLK